MFANLQDSEGRLQDSLRNVPWLWGIEDYPGLGAIVFACFSAYSEANAKALRRAFPAS